MAYNKMLPSSRRFRSEKNPAAAGMQNAREESEATRRKSRGQKSAHQTVKPDTIRTRSLQPALHLTVQSEKKMGLTPLLNSLNTAGMTSPSMLHFTCHLVDSYT